MPDAVGWQNLWTRSRFTGVMITSLALAAALSASQPLGLRGDVAPVGKGKSGTVVAVGFQVAPEDRQRAGPRVRVEVTLLHGKELVDRGTAVVDVAADGSAMLYREWPPGEGRVRIVVESLDGGAQGAWEETFVVPVEARPFEAPPGASADAVALAPGVASPEGETVQFLPPPREGGIGALQLEVKVPPDTARVEFSQDGQALVTRQRPPWTVSVELGEVAHRTTVHAVAFRGDGSFIGEDALVLNAPANRLPVEILVGPESAHEGSRTVTVSVGSPAVDGVTLKADEKVLATWLKCPCAVRVSSADLKGVKVLSAEAHDERGTRGEAVKVLGEAGFGGEVRVEEVELPVVVLDREGRLITGLPRDAFRVLEDGVEVPVDAFATTADLPLSLGIAVDVSGSMKPEFPRVRQAVDAFLSRVARPGDRMFLLTFAWDPEIRVGWTGQRENIADALARVEPNGGTSLHDAVVRALEQFRSRRGRNAVVLLTDGDDTTSRTAWDVTLRYVRTARTPVFTIGFNISKIDFFIRDRLKELAADTGGEAFFAGKTNLDDVYRRIGDQLRAQYVISYRSPSNKARDAFRTVKVEVKREGLLARTIAGYYPSS